MPDFINTWIHEIEALIILGSAVMILGTANITAKWMMMK